MRLENLVTGPACILGEYNGFRGYLLSHLLVFIIFGDEKSPNCLLELFRFQSEQFVD